MRKAISTRTRFEVFKRDGFVCQYCGNHPPHVILHVDHIVAVADGGENDMDNLATSCDKCNLGKSSVSLKSIPKSLSEKASDIQEKEAQLKGYYDVIQARKNRIEDQSWRIVEIIEPDATEFKKEWLLSVRKFLEKLSYHEVQEAMEIAVAKKSNSPTQYIFTYFCGICWNKIREADNG